MKLLFKISSEGSLKLKKWYDAKIQGTYHLFVYLNFRLNKFASFCS